jgi:hypothetical protein
MALRPNTAFQRFTSYTVHRDDEEAYFGTDGDVSLSFNATRNCLVADGQGTAVEVRGLNMAPDRLMLEKVFGGKLVTINASVLFSTDNDFEVLGTNADATEITNDPEGGLILTTEGAANDQTILVPITTAGRSPWSSNTWGTDKQTRFEAVIRTGASVATEKIWVGLKLTNTNVLTTDADQAFFLYDTAGAAVAAKWHAIYSIANVDTDVSTTLADVAASTTYHFLIDIDSARLARFYINGTLVATSTALTTAVDLIPYIGIMDTAGAAKTITAVKASISRQQG